MSDGKLFGKFFFCLITPIAFQSLVVTVRTAILNTQQFSILPTEHFGIYCTCLRKNIEVFPIQPSTAGFCKRGGNCLLRGTDWALYMK